MTARISLAWLAHPVTLLALAVLLVNDHVLKAAWPGLVTGKLSDVAGLLVAPPLLAVLVALCAPRLPSRGVAAGATAAVGVGFAAVKSSGTAAAAASALWTVVAGPSTVRADLTDLLALPALLGALAVWRHARTRPAPARVARLLRVGVVLPLALVGVAATSADGTGTTVHASVDESQRLVVQADRGYLVSTDGGRTFQRQGFEQADYGDLTASAAMQCLPGRSLCYRAVRDRLLVEQSDDDGSTWTVAWELPERTRELLAREHDGLLGSSGVMSYDLVVLPLAEGGHVVVVANGRDGLVVRDVTGAWTRVGDGAEPAAPLPSGLLPVRQWFAHIWPELGWVLLAALWCLTAATVVGLHRSGARRSALTVGLIAATGPCLLAMSPLVALDWTHLVWRGDDESFGRGWDQGLPALAGILLAAGSLAALIVPVVVASIGWGRRVLDRRHVRLAILAGVVVYLPYVVWGSGATTDYRAVSLAALAVFVLALIGVTVHAALARPALPPATWQIPAYPLPAPRPSGGIAEAAPAPPSSGAAQPTVPGGDATAARRQPPGGEDEGTRPPELRSAAPVDGGPGDGATPHAQES